MNGVLDPIAETGLKFFGKMTASVSHDLKNVLAIINENAGLMKDLSQMALKGAALNPEKIENLATRLERQVVRADQIIKTLNQFAHSTDISVKPIEIGEAVAMMLALAQRLIAGKSCEIRFQQPDRSCMVNSNPFFLQNLLWFCLEWAMDHAGAEKTIILDCKINADRILLSFNGLDPSACSRTSPQDLLTNKNNAVMNFLEAELNLDGRTASMILSLPRQG